MHKKIDELSQEEKKTLLAEYDDGVIKIKELLVKYDLDYKPGKLASVLPGKESDVLCPYCNKLMIIPRSRTTKHAPVCATCGHRENDCSCSGCLQIKRDNHMKFEKIIYDYLSEIPRNQHFFHEINIGFMLRLLHVYDVAWDSEAHCLMGENMSIEDHDELYDNGLINLDKMCPIKAFQENDKFDIIYNKKKAHFSINISDFEEKVRLYRNNMDIFPELSSKDRYTLYQELVYEDLIEKFEIIMEERGMSLKRTEKGIKSFKYLITKLSYAELSNICFRVGLYYLDKVTTGVIPKYKVSSMALSSTETFYNNSIAKGWPLGKSSVAHANWQLSCFIKYVMNKPIDILEKKISEEDFL